MANLESFKVIIAGGGVAGLTLANALEKAGVDFLLLEKREIAPQTGASIILQCHTARIFEQLGIWKQIRAATFSLTGRFHFDERGKLFDDSPIFKLVEEITGWPVVLIERQSCLDVLYNGLEDKSRIRTNVGVVSFEEDEHGITVKTDHGDSIRGSILVAADGVHSTIRGFLANAVSETDPERSRCLNRGFTSSYRAIFGTSTNGLESSLARPLLPEGIINHAYHRNVSGITAAGAKGLIFWFLFIKETEPSIALSGQKYTEADATETIKKYGNLLACPGYTFHDLWRARVRAGMVPMEEGVIQGPWNNSGRVVLVGDSICKVSNLAVEAVCNLVNGLVPLIRKHRSPTTKDILDVFTRYEKAQRPRAEISVKTSHYVTRYESMDSLWLRFLRWLSPWIPTSYHVKSFLGYMKPAPFLNFLANSNPGQNDGAGSK
ncbi:FAD/NAD(P)-binding domain-containing protein [Daldinia caldariorum]|uniref:FAD/NAD(P)-binding domain-containing protein n=1 Tax=Daldinia caldariorum TaxID=326644 RepID=UPI002007D0C7|nr:FAD/NAD(P)-binding domain-containing protein [Daldinia caldariorum]KAI1463066.1 FAD/NAD(P)-binding domain-containing protein [Daldinia caldariorum]